MPKDIAYHSSARNKLMIGVDKLANTVKTTLGPKGRYVMLEKPDTSPVVTNDGATIAKEIELDDHLEDMGAQVIKEVASSTNDMAGDGTTTATVLAQCIMHEGVKELAAGANPVELKKGIQGATQLVVAAIKKLATPAETRDALEKVASIAACDVVIGGMIAQALEAAGRDGVVTVDEASSGDTTMAIMEGMHSERGYLSPDMATNKDTMVAELDDPYILITDRTITDPQEIAPLLDRVAEQKKPLLIIAEGVEGAALGTLLLNKKKGILETVAVQPPAYGEGRRARMDDLAVLTGGVFITEEMGYLLRDTTVEMLGKAASVKVSRRDMVIVGGAGGSEALATRIHNLRMLVEGAEYDFDKKQLEERLARLASNVVLIKVGAATESEMKEKKLRFNDALNAARAAAGEGIVPGGGTVYLSSLPAVEAFAKTLTGDARVGAQIVARALKEPTRQIATNAGLDGGAVVATIIESPAGIGFNAATGEYENLVLAGVVDSAKVARLALQNAASAVSVLLTTEAGVATSKK